MIKYIFLLGFAFLYVITIGEKSSFKNTLKKAQSENKKVLLNFSGSDWCLPCIRLEKEVFSQDFFSNSIQDYIIFFKADFPRDEDKIHAEQREENKELAETYNPQGVFPYTVLMNSEGSVIYVWEGYPKAKAKDFVSEVIQKAKE